VNNNHSAQEIFQNPDANPKNGKKHKIFERKIHMKKIPKSSFGLKISEIFILTDSRVVVVNKK
jgi:hypothetical protein